MVGTLLAAVVLSNCGAWDGAATAYEDAIYPYLVSGACKRRHIHEIQIRRNAAA